jgi:hypothetical protein
VAITTHWGGAGDQDAALGVDRQVGGLKWDFRLPFLTERGVGCPVRQEAPDRPLVAFFDRVEDVAGGL